MRSDFFVHDATDGVRLHVYRWLPDEGAAVKAVVHIAHGMAEHAGRYEHVARALTGAGYAVYAGDHRGHGKTASADELGYFGPGDAWSRVVKDLAELIERERAEHPSRGIVLFGHSMGSFIAQQYLIDHSDRIVGAVLSGTSGDPGPLAAVGRVIARIERAVQGERGKSKIIDKMSFSQYNKAFAPNRTDFDWLSRDEAEVDKYIADPLCGFTCSATMWGQVLGGLAAIARPEAQARIRKDIPVYVFSGSEDPVGGRMDTVEQLLRAYRRAGLGRVSHRFYPGGRHEMVNETNRDEVIADLLGWLEAHVASQRQDTAARASQ